MDGRMDHGGGRHKEDEEEEKKDDEEGGEGLLGPLSHHLDLSWGGLEASWKNLEAILSDRES